MDKFTQEETALVAGYFNNLKISPMAPDAIGLCQQLQSIVSKMTVLTEQEKTNESASPKSGVDEPIDINAKPNRNRKTKTA